MNNHTNILKFAVLLFSGTSLVVEEVQEAVETKEPVKLETESRLQAAMEKIIAQENSRFMKLPKLQELSPEKKARMEEVREVMEWMDAQGMLTDDTQIEKLIGRINETALADTEALYNDLDLLQDFLRQIDNGETFGKLKGFEVLFGLIDISSWEKVKSDGYVKVVAMAVIVFNAAIQNNPKAIELALRAGGLKSLTDCLRTGMGSSHGAVAKRVVSTISSLTRDTPEAQKRFLSELDGVNLLLKTLTTFSDDHNVTQKVLTTVTDLITSDHAAPVAAFKDTLWLDAISDMLESENLDLVEHALRFFTVFPLNYRNTPEKLKKYVGKLRSSFMHELAVENDEDLKRFDRGLLDLAQVVLDKLKRFRTDQNRSTRHTRFSASAGTPKTH